MRNRVTWRNGLGLSQIMATLLVVLPTIAFIVTLILEYYTVMQADYKLKLIANLAADYVNSKEDTTDWSDLNTKLLTPVNTKQLCPNGTTLVSSAAKRLNDQSTGQINIQVEYDYTQSVYISDKTLSTGMITYSYHDQNLSITLECQ